MGVLYISLLCVCVCDGFLHPQILKSHRSSLLCVCDVLFTLNPYIVHTYIYTHSFMSVQWALPAGCLARHTRGANALRLKKGKSKSVWGGSSSQHICVCVCACACVRFGGHVCVLCATLPRKVCRRPLPSSLTFTHTHICIYIYMSDPWRCLFFLENSIPYVKVWYRYSRDTIQDAKPNTHTDTKQITPS